jgi:demethylmenaquinone methyltransferase/2-methoxy-6-polyprenyl-1,4-benzoquinol methylase
MGGESVSWKMLVKALEKTLPFYDEGSKVASLGTIQKFREKAVSLLTEKVGKVEFLLDGGIGPGEMTKTILKKVKPKVVVGLDPSVLMLKKARQELKNIQDNLHLVRGIFEYSPLKPESVDLAVFSFSLRDALNLEKALPQIENLLKPNGLMLILDVGKPTNKFLKTIYRVYWFIVAPIIVKFLLKIRHENPWKQIYQTYLRFPSNSQLRRIISKNFRILTFKEYFLGCVVTILACKNTSSKQY